jgi:salicylate hydroxylase
MEMIDPAIYQGFLRCATNNAWPEHQKHWFTFRKGEDTSSKFGTSFLELWCETGQSSVHRASFLDELVALVPKNIAHFGKKLETIEDQGDHVVLHFADGTTAKHSAVIGCDGVKSRTREIVLGKDHPAARATFSGKYAYRGLIPMDDAAALMGDELARNSQMFFGHGGHILTFPIEQGKIMNVVAFGTKEDGKWDDPEWVKPMNKEAMYQDFKGWTEATQKILSMMQKPDIWALFDHQPAPIYFKGRVCLIGDAAHASTPHNGAGAGQAIEDALCISRLMRLVYDADDIPRAFAAYDKIRRPRSQRQVKVARESGLLYDLQLPGYMDDWEKIKELLQSKQAWLWNHDLSADVKEAERVFREETSRL